MTILTHNFNQINIAQLSENTTIGGSVIPKGYVNATQLCKAGKKLLGSWNRLANSKAYIEALSESMQIHIDLLIVANESEGTNDERGTWVHPEVAIEIARWVSPEFNVWANRTLRLVLNGEFKALTAEAEEAQERLNQIWEEVRSAGKVTRRTLTDAIKDWYQRNPGGTTCPQHAMYARTTDAIYQALWGMKAIEIEFKLGCERHKLRNHLSADCLKILDRAEDRVTEFIDLDNLKPINAVNEAKLRASRVQL